MSGVCSGGGGREPVKIVLIKTQYIETDARSFKSVVQELTGKDSGARGSNLSPASKSRKVRSNLGTKIMEGGMNINGFADLMDSVVLQLCYDGWWETLVDGSMEYVNGNNTAFLIRKDCTFDQFLARVYDVLQINRNEYNITMKTTLRSSNTMYRTCSLPMDIFNDEIVKVVLHMASDVVNYGCIPIFMTTSSRVDYQDLEPPVETETSFRANVSVPDSEEEVLPQTLSLQQRYSPLHGYNDTINDNGITLADVEAEALPPKYLLSNLCCVFKFFGSTFGPLESPVMRHHSPIDKRTKCSPI